MTEDLGKSVIKIMQLCACADPEALRGRTGGPDSLTLHGDYPESFFERNII